MVGGEQPNEADIIRVGTCGPAHVDAVADVFERLAPYAPTVATRGLALIRKA